MSISQNLMVSGLSCDRYADLLEQTKQLSTGYGYLFKKAKEYRVFFDKQAMANSAFSRLALREITFIGYQFKDALLKTPFRAKKVSVQLMRMSQSKAKKQGSSLCQKICGIWERIRNFFAGYGFHSTASLARELARTLESGPAPKPGSMSNPKQAALKPRSGTTGKNRHLLAYRENPKKCKDIIKNAIFMDIKSIEKSPKLSDATTSLVGLIEWITGKTAVDVADVRAVQVILDAFEYGNDNLCGLVAEWLIRQKGCDPDILCQCLGVFIKKFNENKAISYDTMEQLAVAYTKNLGDRPLSKMFVSALEVLLGKFHDGKRETDIIEWMINKNKCNGDAFKRLVQVFIRKEAEHKGLSMVYPLRDRLIAHFNSTPELKTQLREDTSVEAGKIKDYLLEKGAQL